MKSETNGEVEELQNAQVYLTPRPGLVRVWPDYDLALASRIINFWLRCPRDGAVCVRVYYTGLQNITPLLHATSTGCLKSP